PGPPFAPSSASIDSVGFYRWDTTGATLGPVGFNTLYSTQVTIEDLDQSGNVKSKTALDLLIQIVPKVGVAPVFNNPPEIVCGASQGLVVEDTLSSKVSASDLDPGQTVQLNVVGLPLGATMTPGVPLSGNPVSSTFSWTPTLSQLGTTTVVFTARDN